MSQWIIRGYLQTKPISDLSGSVLKEQLYYENEIILYREKMTPGAYIIEVTGNNTYKGVLMVR